MADQEFQSGICGGNWWMPPSKSMFMGGGSSTAYCSTGIINGCDLMAYESSPSSSSWMTDFVDLRTRSSTSSCKDSNININNNNNSMGSHESDQSNSMVFQNTQSQPQQQTDSDSGVSSGIFMDSTLQIMGFGLSSSSNSSSDWNQDLLGRGDQSYNSMIEEDQQMNSTGGGGGLVNTSQAQKAWSSPNNFNSTSQGHQDSLITGVNNGLKPISSDQASFLLSDHQQRQINTVTSSNNSIPITYAYPSTLFQSLLEPQQPLLNTRSMNYSSNTPNIYATNLIQSPASSLPKQQQQQLGSLHLTSNTNTPLIWNASVAALTAPSSFLPSPQPQFVLPSSGEKPNFVKLPAKAHNKEELKKTTEPVLKRPRFETPSPLPTFKVRKEKLGDRITALQQLVSPFGKTDTASVLHEAIDYVKFLHDQLNALSTPYMKNGNPTQHQQAVGDNKLKEQEGATKKDLRSRGLCLVPISSTFPVANETTAADFWNPSFGGVFR